MSGAPLSTAFDFDVELPCDVLEMVLQSHSTTPDHIAVVSGTERVSYRHLMLMASHNAASLEEAGLQAGECLLCGVDAGVELPVVWLSAMMVDAVLIPIDLSWPANRMTAVLASTRARFVYVPRGKRPDPSFAASLVWRSALTVTVGRCHHGHRAAAPTQTSMVSLHQARPGHPNVP